MTSQRVSLRLEDWPPPDRERWRLAQEPAGFLERDKPASRWSPDRKEIVEQSYGRWLSFLDRNGVLDPTTSPGERATKDRLRAFVVELQGRVAPVSVAMMAGALLRILVVLEPGRDWTMLGRAYKHLKRTAAPSRDKLSRMVAATELFELGFRLMDTCEDGPPQRVYKSTQYRDGLMIALLISCPMRLKNLTALVIGRHLLFDGRSYRIELTAAETKTGRRYHAEVPTELTPYVDRYLREHRTVLQSIANPGLGDSTGRRLWLGRSGEVLTSRGVQRQIALRTRAAFGKALWPHLFRDCAVTELVDSAPEEIGIAPDLLGHADLETTRKHYIQAQGMTAHLRVQATIAARRRAAIAHGAADA